MHASRLYLPLMALGLLLIATPAPAQNQAAQVAERITFNVSLQIYNPGNVPMDISVFCALYGTEAPPASVPTTENRRVGRIVEHSTSIRVPPLQKADRTVSVHVPTQGASSTARSWVCGLEDRTEGQENATGVVTPPNPPVSGERTVGWTSGRLQAP